MKQEPRRALISVYDKTNLELLLPCLTEFKYDIIASGKTASKIKELGYEAKEVADISGFPESPGGLLKTLHPRIHGGFLLDPRDDEQERYMRSHNIVPITMLVSNLYPFREVATRKGVTLLEAANNIDIGGPTLVRSAAKAALLRGNVAVLTNPSQYEIVVENLKKNKGQLDSQVTLRLASEAFKLTYTYDDAIQQYLSRLRGA